MSLATLRADPINACMANVYRTAQAAGSFAAAGNLVEGGRCAIAARSPASGFFDLSAQEDGNGRDYFFPWVRQGVGWVRVPGNAPDGTIVMTGGLNGCSIVVSQDGGDFRFYHDGDSRHLTPQMIVGTELARVGNKDYDPLGWGEKAFRHGLEDMRRRNVTPKGELSYGYFVVGVKVAGRFGLYCTGAMVMNGLHRLPIGLSTCLTRFG